jgi:glycerophosphoryl diester phosphodiesterase
LRRVIVGVAALACAALPSAAVAQTPNPWIETRTWNIAHQGGEDEFPSNTMYAFRKSLAAGADMLELDIGVTRDDQIVVMHDTTVDRVTNGRGTIRSKTLRQIRRLDGAYWFRGGPDAYKHGLKARAYRFRGIATGRKRPPRGFKRSDFRVPTLRQVLRAFPGTPINIEIKCRTKAEETSEYVANAEVLASLLSTTSRRDLIVASFNQDAVDRFHELAPAIPVAPGVDGSADYLLGGKSPGEGVVAFQLPITYEFGGSTLNVTTKDNVARAHRDGYAWHTWLSNDPDTPASWKNLVDWCVDGVMTARPRAFERWSKNNKRPASC